MQFFQEKKPYSPQCPYFILIKKKKERERDDYLLLYVEKN